MDDVQSLQILPRRLGQLEIEGEEELRRETLGHGRTEQDRNERSVDERLDPHEQAIQHLADADR